MLLPLLGEFEVVRAPIPMSNEPCVHSMLVKDCISCWEGEALRCGAILKTCRDLLREVRHPRPGYSHTIASDLARRIDDAVEGYP